MTDETDDPSDPEGGADDTDAVVEPALEAWGQEPPEPTWTDIAAEAPGAGSAEPAPDHTGPELDADVVEDEPPEAAAAPPAPQPEPPRSQPASAPQAQPGERRSRRPSSLRDADTDRIPNVPRRTITPPPPPRPRRPLSEAESAQAPSQSSPPPPPVPAGPSALERLVALANERPEVRVGAAFLGGIILASIFKRLARR